MRYHPLHHKKTATSSRRLLVGDVLGWVGAASLIGAYLLVSLGAVSAQSYYYQIMNIIGGGGLLVLAVARRAYPSAVTNVMWVIIGLVALVGLVFGS